MRVVVDTNVFVSAILKVNSLPFLVVRWIDQHGGLLKSVTTEREILSVLDRPHIGPFPTVVSPAAIRYSASDVAGTCSDRVIALPAPALRVQHARGHLTNPCRVAA